MQIILTVRNNRVKSVNLPERTSVHIDDYDTDKYPKDHLEKDSKGALCKRTVWTRYAYNKKNTQIQEVDHVVHVEVRKGKVHVQKCPSAVCVSVVEEEEEKPKRKK